MTIVLGLVLASLVAVLFRLVSGPTPWDRILAASAASTRVLLIMAIVAVATDQDIYLDVAVIYAALSFLGVIILSRSLERTEGDR